MTTHTTSPSLAHALVLHVQSDARVSAARWCVLRPGRMYRIGRDPRVGVEVILPGWSVGRAHAQLSVFADRHAYLHTNPGYQTFVEGRLSTRCWLQPERERLHIGPHLLVGRWIDDASMAPSGPDVAHPAGEPFHTLPIRHIRADGRALFW